MSGGVSGSLALRLAAFALVIVFLQVGVISELPVFGVNADLSSLLVAFVGLMCGSSVGAACGFAVGLFIDLALLQTLGLTSLIFTLIGYWCGRLRELRDPQAALTPLIVGAGASAVALVGYSLMEFMLGVDAPVSFELLRQIVLGTVVNAIVALPMWALTRRALEGALPEDPPPPPAATHLHDPGASVPFPSHERGGARGSAGMTAIEPVRPRDPRVPVSPQLALRVAIIGGVVMVIFGVIFFRLWYLQVLSGEQYVQQADENGARHLPIAAPRGKILDREGQAIVGSTVTNAVQIVPDQLPESISSQVQEYQSSLAVAEAARRVAVARLSGYERALGGVRRKSHEQRHELELLQRETGPPQVAVPPLPRSAVKLERLFRRLSNVIRVSPRTIDEDVVEGITATPYAQVTVKTDAGRGPLTVLGERASEFPGVQQEPVSIREYPDGEMAAQILGYVGSINTTELKSPAFRGVQPGTIVGQAGLEYYYDHYLAGVPGEQRIAVNAEGQPVPSKLTPIPPRAGHTLQTTLDLGLQRASEKALLEGMEHARAGGKPAIAGAFVALDPLNGEVLAMGSSPSFNPSKFAKPMTKAEYALLTGRNGDEPGRLTDLADEGEYPTGSTFKPITAMAALEAGVINPSEGLGAGQCIYVSTERFCNAGMAEYGAANLVDALKVSSDTYFFTVGELANEHGGEIIQKKAKELGVGEPTGIDLPSEFPGVVPSPRWLVEENQLEYKCQREHHGQPCYIVAEPGAPWTVGYNMDLAVGQGELLTDPLQMAVAYSTLANAYRNGGNGTVVTPHLGKQIDEGNGSLVQTLRFPSRPVHLNYEDLSLVMEGIHDAASEQGGTSAEVWAGWDQEEDPVYGKTGTAERTGHVEQSWYMCYIGNAQHPIVICGDRRGRRLRRRNRRADRAPDRLAVVWQAEEVHRRELENVLSPLSPIKPTEEAPVAPPRTLRLPLDPLLTLAVIGLGICSVVTLKAATSNLAREQLGDAHYYVNRQIVYLAIGFVLMLGISRLDYAHLRRYKNVIYGALLISILAVLGLGRSANGAVRSINFPLFSFQASEVGKVLLIVALSAFIVDRARHLRERDTTVRVLIAALVPTIFVIAQPDLGSGLVYMTIACMLLFVAGTSWRHLAGLAALVVVAIAFVLAAGPAVGVHVLKPYQVERLTAFLHPTSDVQKEGAESTDPSYQQQESKIAIGSGGKTGRGANADQVPYGFVPESDTDFVFAALGERYGFVGAGLVLLLYALLISRTLRVLVMAKDLFGSLIAAGVAAMLIFQVFVNVGMTIGIMPITGVTLPLMSYGGSSVIATLLSVGLLQSIYVQARTSAALKGRVLRY